MYTRADMIDPSVLGAFVVVGLAAAGIGWGVWSNLFGSGRTERERQEKLAAQRPGRARAKGWRFDGTHEGDIRYRIHGESPGRREWTMAYDSDHASSTPRPKLVFRAPHAGRGGMHWRLRSRKAHESMMGSAGRVMMGVMATMLAGRSSALAAHREFMERAREIPAGSSRFRQRFVLFGVDPSAATLIDAEIERLVLGWPRSAPMTDDALNVTLHADRLELTLACEGPDFEVIEHLATLGESLLSRLPAHR